LHRSNIVLLFFVQITHSCAVIYESSSISSGISGFLNLRTV